MVNIYLEDDQQLDQVYCYLNELYTTAVASAPCLTEVKFMERVPFILDVLLPEVSQSFYQHLLIISQYGMFLICRSEFMWYRYLQDVCLFLAGHHPCHSWSGQHLSKKGRRKIPEGTMYQ